MHGDLRFSVDYGVDIPCVVMTRRGCAASLPVAHFATTEEAATWLKSA